MNDVFQVALTDEELRMVTGGATPSANFGGEVFAQYATDSNNYANASIGGSATGYPHDASGNVAANAFYNNPQNYFGYNSLGGFNGD